MAAAAAAETLLAFESPLATATLVGRAGRFTLSARDPAGGHLLLHLPNSGRLSTILVPGSPVYYLPATDGAASRSARPRRTAGRALLVDPPGLGLSVIDANLLAQATAAALRRCAPPGALGLGDYAAVREELAIESVAHGRRRLDIGLLDGSGAPVGLLEVKSVTLVDGTGTGLFPDAPTQRGAGHVRLLGDLAASGMPTALVFAAGRPDIRRVRPNAALDEAFAVALRQAVAQGLRVVAWRPAVTLAGLDAGPVLEVDLR